jgi:hypothetical protein
MIIANSHVADLHVAWKAMPGAPHLRYCAAHRLVAWEPHRVSDDRLLNQIDHWLFVTENVSSPRKRFIDFSRLTNISLPIGRAFAVVSGTAHKSSAVPPVKCAFFCDKSLGFAIARLYETLTNSSSIEARAFRDRAAAARWLEVPAPVLNLRQDASSYHGKRSRFVDERHVTV